MTPHEYYLHLFERYKLLIQARNFHYDNFLKWSTFFYTLIGALFVGLYNLLGKNEDNFYVEIIVILGYVVSLAALWSAKGYYHWHINFVKMTNHYEKEVLKFSTKHSIYSVVYDKYAENLFLSPHRGANYSTAKISIFLISVITCIWGFIALRVIVPHLLPCIACYVAGSIFLTLGLTCISVIFFQSDKTRFEQVK